MGKFFVRSRKKKRQEVSEEKSFSKPSSKAVQNKIGRLHGIGRMFSPQPKKKKEVHTDGYKDDTVVHQLDTFSLSSSNSDEDDDDSKNILGDRYTSFFQSPAKPSRGSAVRSEYSNLPNPLDRHPRQFRSRLDLPLGKYSKDKILTKVQEIVEQDADSLLGGTFDMREEIMRGDSGVEEFKSAAFGSAKIPLKESRSNAKNVRPVLSFASKQISACYNPRVFVPTRCGKIAHGEHSRDTYTNKKNFGAVLEKEFIVKSRKSSDNSTHSKSSGALTDNDDLLDDSNSSNFSMQSDASSFKTLNSFSDELSSAASVSPPVAAPKKLTPNNFQIELIARGYMCTCKETSEFPDEDEVSYHATHSSRSSEIISQNSSMPSTIYECSDEETVSYYSFESRSMAGIETVSLADGQSTNTPRAWKLLKNVKTSATNFDSFAQDLYRRFTVGDSKTLLEPRKDQDDDKVVESESPELDDTC
uniref:Uncharacterized protein n=1 Tax=Chaetoceros debilis TaxID=122233 RepID=A0A7S3QJL5_9STRA